MQRLLIPAIFLLSGAGGLIFEIVWSRQLVLVFGNTTQAVSAILTGFFGGMAIGSALGGRIADRVRQPLRLYAYLELALVGIVLLTPASFALIHETYRSAFGVLEGSPTALSLLRFLLALVALAPATILMGATLPTLTRFLARQSGELSGAFSRLYFANTMGAVLGSAFAGFVLIELFGLWGALLVGVGCSALAGVLALVFDQYVPVQHLQSAASSGESPRFPASPHFNLALSIAFISGLTSLGYQVIWMRLLASGTGSSTYVFALILTVFLVGLALGAVEYKRRGSQAKDVVLLLSRTQLVLALLAVIGAYLINALDGTVGALLWKTLIVVLPATFVMGLSFPASSALLGGSDTQVGSRAGLLLAANTFGAIVATFAIPFVFIPLLSSPVSLGLLATVNAITGTVLVFHAHCDRRAKLQLGGVGVGLVAAISILLFSGALFQDPGVVRLSKMGAEVQRTEEDEIASVQAGVFAGEKQLWVTGFGMTALTVDAKLMPILPLILRPTAQSVLVVAFGMGTAYRSALIAGLEADAVELVPSVPKVFGVFYQDASTVLGHPNGRIIIADGRSYVELTEKSYDLVVVDPPPPLESAGVSVISSHEFYLASKRRLAPHGIMMQWVPGAQTTDDFKNHVRTFRSVFQHVIIAAGPGGWGFYMLGSETRMAFDDEMIRSVLSRPGVLQDISSAKDSPESSMNGWTFRIKTLIRLQGDDVKSFAGGGPLITDDRPLPEYFLLKRALGPQPEVMKLEEIRPTHSLR